VQESQEKYYYNLTEKKAQVKQQLDRIDEQVKIMKHKQVQDEEEAVKDLVEKLVQKEEAFKRILK
jgi:hypothetical protein